MSGKERREKCTVQIGKDTVIAEPPTVATGGKWIINLSEDAVDVTPLEKKPEEEIDVSKGLAFGKLEIDIEGASLKLKPKLDGKLLGTLSEITIRISATEEAVAVDLMYYERDEDDQPILVIHNGTIDVVRKTRHMLASGGKIVLDLTGESFDGPPALP